MHIACDRHGSRIMFFPDRIIHRSDGSPCYSIGFGAGEKHFLRHALKLRAAEKAVARSLSAWRRNSVPKESRIMV